MESGGSGKTSIISMAISEIPVVEAQKIENEKWYSKLYKRIKKLFTAQRIKKKIKSIIQFRTIIQ